MRVVPSDTWTFRDAVRQAQEAYRGYGIASRGGRNSVLRMWGAVVGRSRALSEFDSYVAQEGGSARAATALGIAISTLKALRRDFSKLPSNASDVVEVRYQGFLLMPFKPELDWLHDLIKRAGRDVAVEISRADNIFGAGVILDQVKQKIRSADVVVAVCTGKNANVFYELGMAESHHKPILIGETPDDLPFDLQHFRALYYGYPDDPKSNAVSLNERLQHALKETLAESTTVPAAADSVRPIRLWRPPAPTLDGSMLGHSQNTEAMLWTEPQGGYGPEAMVTVHNDLGFRVSCSASAKIAFLTGDPNPTKTRSYQLTWWHAPEAEATILPGGHASLLLGTLTRDQDATWFRLFEFADGGRRVFDEWRRFPAEDGDSGLTCYLQLTIVAATSDGSASDRFESIYRLAPRFRHGGVGIWACNNDFVVEPQVTGDWVHLAVTNLGQPEQFGGQVTRLSGTASHETVPYGLPWRGHADELRLILSGQTQLINVAQTDQDLTGSMPGGWQPGFTFHSTSAQFNVRPAGMKRANDLYNHPITISSRVFRAQTGASSEVSFELRWKGPVNGHLKVPGFGQEKVPTPAGYGVGM